MNAAGTHEAVAVKDHSRHDLLRIYEHAKTISVGVASADGRKTAHIIPVNPRGGEILGERSYPSLEEIDARVHVVDVFSPPGRSRLSRDRRSRSASPAGLPEPSTWSEF